MGVLAGFLKNENRNTPPATVATVATFTPDRPQELRELQLSQGTKSKSDFSDGDKPAHNLTISAYDSAQLQRIADERNMKAAREHSTDRFCACGSLAGLAWPDRRGREVWRCDRCELPAEIVDNNHGPDR